MRHGRRAGGRTDRRRRIPIAVPANRTDESQDSAYPREHDADHRHAEYIHEPPLMSRPAPWRSSLGEAGVRRRRAILGAEAGAVEVAPEPPAVDAVRPLGTTCRTIWARCAGGRYQIWHARIPDSVRPVLASDRCLAQRGEEVSGPVEVRHLEASGADASEWCASEPAPPAGRIVPPPSRPPGFAFDP